MQWSGRYVENWTLFSTSQVLYTAASAASELLNWEEYATQNQKQKSKTECQRS